MDTPRCSTDSISSQQTYISSEHGSSASCGTLTPSRQEHIPTLSNTSATSLGPSHPPSRLREIMPYNTDTGVAATRSADVLATPERMSNNYANLSGSSPQLSNPSADIPRPLPPVVFPIKKNSLPAPTRPSDNKMTKKAVSFTTTTRPPAKLNPTNFTSIYRKTKPNGLLSFSKSNSSISGVFSVNPFLNISPTLLPPLRPGEKESERKNLILEVENGGIDVDINLLGVLPPNFSPVRRTTLFLGLKGKNHNTFPITARVGTLTPNYRQPFFLTVVGKDGDICLHLPRSFHGMVNITVHIGDLAKKITFSDELDEQSTILTESTRLRAYFVGNLSSTENWSWVGDRVDISVEKGRVTVLYEGEKKHRSRSGWWH